MRWDVVMMLVVLGIFIVAQVAEAWAAHLERKYEREDREREDG